MEARIEPPDVSVVMSVYNAARYLDASIASIRAQEGVAFEFIVVDDGSTDESSDLISRHARSDSRLRVIRQPNQGLTRALVRGCLEARGQFIARQDADDISLPGRLRAQTDLLRSESYLSLVGCWMRYIGPLGEDLGTWDPPAAAEEATRALRCGSLRRLRGLGGHGSAMFRREEYVRVGGYRPQFYYAQDLDLWLRLTDVGSLSLVPRVLYCWRFSPSSITGTSRPAQVETARLILEAARRRERSEPEGPVLACAANIRPSLDASNRSAQEAAGLYFIGKMLFDRRDNRAIGYLRRAIRGRPWHLRSWLALAAALALTDRKRPQGKSPPAAP